VTRPAPPSREGGVQSPVGAQLLVLVFFFLSTVLLLHLNSIYTLFMALHNTAIRIKKKFQVSFTFHQTPKEGRFAQPMRVCYMCRRHCLHSVLKYGNKHTTIHGRIGSVARHAPPSRDCGVQWPRGRNFWFFLFHCSS
jgi:hypothetical protein